jgi:hypothetical protein
MPRSIRGRTLVAVVAIAGAMLVAGTAPAGATKPPDHKVTICHATHSVRNPYVQITVDIASSGYVKGGHARHTGPVPSSIDDLKQFKADHVHWGDIIPPYDYGTFHFDGLNNTDEGLAILENGCALPNPPPVMVRYRVVRRMPGVLTSYFRGQAGLGVAVSCDGVNYTVTLGGDTMVTVPVGTARHGSIVRVWSQGSLLVRVRQSEVC